MTEDYIIHPELDGSSFFYPGGKVGFVLLHGFTATTTEMLPLGEALRDAGFTVSAPLLPGHGTHPDDLNNTHWQDWYRTAESEFERLSAICDTVWLGGESMGGLLSLLLAAKNPKVGGILLYAPALTVRRMRVAYVAQYFMKYLAKSNTKDDTLWKGYNVYPLKGVVELLKLQKEARKVLADVKQPTLAFFSEKDATVGVAPIEMMRQKLGSGDFELVILKESPHVILLGGEQQVVIEHTLSFLSERLNEDLDVKSPI